MSSENPYAYFPTEEKSVRPWEQAENGQNTPVSPDQELFKVKLLYGGMFSKKNCEMKVYPGHLFLEVPFITPIIIQRNEAKDSIKFKMTQLVITTPKIKKMALKSQKASDKELQLARLDVWAKSDPMDVRSTTIDQIKISLRKFCSWVTWANVLFLGILQLLCFIGICIFIAYAMQDTTGTEQDRMKTLVFARVFAALFAFNSTINIGLSILLAYRQAWAMNAVVIFYFAIMALALYKHAFFGILIPIIVLVQAIMGQSALSRQMQQIAD